MSSGFDPCKQWLGIDALSLSDPWLVLGIARGETNPLAIVRAADAKLAVLRAVPAGPLTLARDALVKRVEAARDELLAAASQGAPAAPAPLAPPPRPTFAPPPVPMAPPVPQVVAAAEPSPTVRLNGRPVVKQSTGSSAVVAVISLLAVVTASYFAYQILESRKKKSNPKTVAAVTKTPNNVEDEKPRPAKPSKNGPDDSRGSRKPTPQPDDAPDSAAPEPEPTDSERRKPGPKPDTGESPADVKMRTKTEPEAEPEPEPEAEPKPKPKPDPEPPDEKPTRGARPQAEPDPETEPDSKPKPVSKPRGDADGLGDEPEMRPKPKPAPPADSEPAPEPTPPKPSPTSAPEPDSADPAAAAAEVAKLLREAYAALRESEFDTANAALKTALNKAGDDDKLTLRVNCFRQLSQYAEQLLGYRDEAFKAATDGGIYELPSGKMLAVVEISDKELVYKEGVNKRIPIDEIPPSWLLAIVTKWFEAEDKPGNHVFLGVYHVLKEKPNLKAAESEWGLAAFGGENVSFLTPLLRDPLLQPKAEAGN